MSIYKVSNYDIDQIRFLGFSIEEDNTIADEFINANFPGFHLLNFLLELDVLLNSLAQDTLVKIVLLQKQPLSKLTIEFYSDNLQDVDNRLVFKRSFIKLNDEIVVYHDYLILPLISRGQRIGRKVLALCLKYYLVLNVNKVMVHAALENGGLEWAKAGFRATKPVEMQAILQDAKTNLGSVQYNLVKRLYEDYYNKNLAGNAFPIIEWAAFPFMKEILKRHTWHGELNLKNSQDLFNFNEYVNG